MRRSLVRIVLCATLFALPATGHAAVLSATGHGSPSSATGFASPAPGDADPASLQIRPRAGSAVSAAAAPSSTVAFFDYVDSLGRGWYLGHDNTDGDLGWGESYVMTAYLEMYRATGDRTYLDRFVCSERAVLAHTDESRHVTDYAGRSGPVWRSGSRYGYGTLLIMGTDGLPLGFLVSKRERHNNQMTAEVGRTTKRGTFRLTIRWRVLHLSEVYDNVTTDGRSRDWWVRRLRGSRLVRVEGLRPPGDRTRAVPMRQRPLEAAYLVHAVQTGIIAFPLVRFSRIVASDPSLAPVYGAEAARCLDVARRGLAFHEPEWVPAGDRGYYRFPPGSPIWCDGLGLPYNQQAGIGRAFIEMWLATGEPAYRQRAEMIARLIRAGLADTYLRGWAWHYWWGPAFTGWRSSARLSMNTPTYAGYRSWEDLNHAGVDVDFIADAADAGIVFGPADIARLANTLTLAMPTSRGFNTYVVPVKATPLAASTVRAARWLRVATLSRDVYDATALGLRRELPGAPFGAGLYAASLLAGVESSYAADPAAARTAPTIRILDPVPTSARGSLSILAEAGAGADGPPALYVSGASGVGLAMGPASWMIDTTALRDGSYNLDVVTADTTGLARYARRVVRFDNTPPSVRWLASPSALTPNGDGDRDRVVWSAWASEGGQRRVIVTDEAGTEVRELYSWRWVSPGALRVGWDGRGAGAATLPEGSYTIEAWARDAAGNERAYPARRVLVSRLVSWKAAVRGRLAVRAGSRVGLRLARASRVSATLLDGRRVAYKLRALSWARPGLVFVTLPAGRHAVKPGTYTLSVSVGTGAGRVPLSRTVAVR